ncbi:hypothetical protein [Streptomyces marianii]|uniref:hypothetical protein n=1 Tax=Streptomyces marianii TaxID=1817406 RepID=UPI0018F8BB61|nr:hypothetical protein [Streptomyces marianii]
MSDETMRPAGGGELPAVDEVLAAALCAQGEPGVRALDLLQDARRILAGGLLRRPAEVAESCLRGASDALLSLPGAPEAAGLKDAAAALLAAVDARPGRSGHPAAAPRDETAAPDRPALAAQTGAAGRVPAGPPQPVAVPRQHAGPPADTSAAGAEEQLLLRRAADTLRAELNRPGGYHRARAAGIAEHLMGVRLGAAQQEALGVWGEVYGKTSGTLHGGSADPARAAALYRRVLAAARELLVPLPGRAARVLHLAALESPGPEHARELAGWADPRATAFFFRSGPAPAWLAVLHEHAPHLLLADETSGRWPAAPFLQHLAATAPDTARPWLADHAVPLAAAGTSALIELLHPVLARAFTPATVRSLLPAVLVPPPPGPPAEQAGWPRGLTAHWAGTLPPADRDGDWVLVVEGLLKDAVDSGLQAFHAFLELHPTAPERAPAAARTAPPTDPHAREAIERIRTVLLPERDVIALLRKLVATVHPADGEPFRWARPVRGALAGLLRRSVETAGDSALARADLDEIRLRDEDVPFLGMVLGPFLGPFLARAVLDLAAADAAAGVPLAERLRAWPRIAAAHEHLHDRLLAAHLTAHPPTTGTDTAAARQWWDRAADVTVRLLAEPPTPEGARLTALVWDTCPPERTVGLQQRARAALGPAPSAREVDHALPTTGRTAGTAQPPAPWQRVWAWSPVLPAPLLADFGPLLAALRRREPAGPPDPRAAARPRPRHHVAHATQDLLKLAAAAGPFATAAELAQAPDAGADGYARVLQRLVAADPPAWTADVPRVLATLARPDLGAFYLAATHAAARYRGAFPNGPAPAALAALALRRALPAAGGPPSTAVDSADQALFGLLNIVWRTGADLGTNLPAVLAHLHTLAEPLTHPAPPTGAEQQPAAGLPQTPPAVRALACLLEYAASHAHADGTMPDEVLHLLADVLAARPGDEDVATAIGVHLPVLHYRATAFTTAHPELYDLAPRRPSPAAAWLSSCHPDPTLLAALDRDQLLAAVREDHPGAALHTAHALLAGHRDPLGDPAAAWRELTAGPGGAAAASHLLMPLALLTPARPRPGTGGPAPAAITGTDTALVWWTAALDAGLPPGALADAGYFTGTFPDEVWLPLARRSAAHTPAQTDADKVAERAAAHPRSPDALLLAAHLLTRPAPDPAYDTDVRRHARALLQAAAALPETERPAETEQLRRALVEAGEVDLAQTDSAAG